MKWDPALAPQPVREHWARCPGCDHVLECGLGPSEDGGQDTPPHLSFGRWRLAASNVPDGLAFLLHDQPNTTGTLLYGAWLPQREALALRDHLLAWWPLDRYPTP